MSFLDDIFAQLEAAGDTPIAQELRDGSTISVNGRELLKLIGEARDFLFQKKIPKGDRCALLAHNSIEWVAMDLAIMADGLIVVPLYARQAPAELVCMMKDGSPSLICCGDAILRDAIVKEWAEAPPQCLFDDVFGKSGENKTSRAGAPAPHKPSDPVTIIYTSGTSGEAKGVVLNTGNVGHMLQCTSHWLPENKSGQDRVFHYLPFCFAGSWIMLLTSLLLRNLLIVNTDLTKLPSDMRSAAPDYFLNVPALLERMRKAVDEQLWKTGGIALSIYSHAKGAWFRRHQKQGSLMDSVWLSLAKAIVFPTIRKKMIGPNLKALICGSAPLNVETQLYFMMLGIPVLQVYGLTETTAICTMDDPHHVEAGRVGPAIKGIEMKTGENDEI
ncbi:MAG: AMP-binding protein, partial [Terriglobales bacterium]